MWFWMNFGRLEPLEAACGPLSTVRQSLTFFGSRRFFPAPHSHIFLAFCLGVV